jgi:hypothetical protein
MPRFIRFPASAFTAGVLNTGAQTGTVFDGLSGTGDNDVTYRLVNADNVSPEFMPEAPAPTRSYLGGSFVNNFVATHNHTAPVSLNAGQKYVVTVAATAGGTITSLTANGTAATQRGYFTEPQNNRIIVIYEVTPASSGAAVVLTASGNFGTNSRLAYYEVSNAATFQNAISAEDRFTENLSLNLTVSAGDLLIGMGYLAGGTAINFSAGLTQDEAFTNILAESVVGSAANVAAASPRTITLNRTGGSNTGFLGVIARFS